MSGSFGDLWDPCGILMIQGTFWDLRNSTFKDPSSVLKGFYGMQGSFRDPRDPCEILTIEGSFWEP